MRTIDTCRLCEATNVALHKSHIWPEFLYREIYDPRTHSFNVYSNKSTIPPSQRRKGIYEPLLCSQCEHSFRDYETYACAALFNGLKQPPELHKQFFLVRGLDYTLLKLFFLSLLWRAGVSKRPEFMNVKLGTHTSIIQRMLLRQIPGEPLEYPVALLTMKGGTKGVMSLPEPFKDTHGLRGYRAIMAGFSWMFVVGRHRDTPLRGLVLDKSGNLPLIMDDGGGMKFLSHRAMQT